MPTCLATTGPDDRFMLRAAELALKGRGATAPNPCVGAVLARGDAIVAEGWHKKFGGPHAEIECLADAKAKGVDPAQCTLYVTLEPCNHYGKTPPCTKAILAAGIKRVVVGCADPNPDVTGGGAQTLREAGVTVTMGVEETLCKDLIDEFVVWKTTERPYNLLKMASTIDGKIAARGGRPQPVSGPEARLDVHRMRAQAGAIIIGGNTFYGDNPRLTCRLDPEELPEGFRQPLAVIVTGKLPSAYSNYTLLRQWPERVVFWTTEYSAKTPLADEMRGRGSQVWGLPDLGAGLDLLGAFVRLRREFDCHRTLCEGGGRLAFSLVKHGLIDEFVLFMAPRVLGDAQGKSLFSGEAVQSMDQTIPFRLAHASSCGDDLRLAYKPVREAF